MYFSGQGKLFYATRDENGNPGSFSYAGNVPSLKVTLTTETTEHVESTSGQRLTDFRLTTSKKAEIDFQLEDWSLDNLATGLYGIKQAATTGDTVTAEDLGSPITGQYVPLQNTNVSGLVITDSTPTTPKTLVEGTDYTLNAAFGSVQFIGDLSGYVLPLSGAYTWAANVGSVTLFSQLAPERWFRFEGLNTANQNSPVLVELYRTIVDPMKELDLINDALLQMELTGSALYDAQRGADAAFGNFGRVVFLA